MLSDAGCPSDVDQMGYFKRQAQRIQHPQRRRQKSVNGNASYNTAHAG
jgi:hypothetical protein